MPFAEFVYPALNEPLVEAYGGAFESVYVVLHPFVRVPEALSWRQRRAYPSDEEIRGQATKCRWAEVARGAGISSCARMSQALLTTIHAVEDYLCDLPAAEALVRYLQAEPVWMPAEGRFEPLLEKDFLAVFEMGGCTEMVFVPEFAEKEQEQRFSIEALWRGEREFPERGSLVAPDGSFLLTVDWNSFFTLLYGKRKFVEQVVRSRKLEGFFAEKETEHFWFNWKMGCATCTVSPEGWTEG